MSDPALAAAVRQNPVPVQPPEFTVTTFRDYEGREKGEREFTIEALAEHIRSTTALTRDGLPRIKMANFGSLLSGGGSYRNNANVLAIHGVEADYDAGTVPLDEAVRRLEDKGVTAIVYTTPSVAPGLHKWRIMCPLSRPHDPVDRDRLLARLAGLFGPTDIFDKASWTLSQAFFIGAVGPNPLHRVEVVEGQCIDQCGDLDATAIFPPRPWMNGGSEHPATPPEAIPDKRIRGKVASLLKPVSDAAAGEKHHVLFKQGMVLGGYLHLLNWTPEQARDELVAALSPPIDRKKSLDTAVDAIRRGMDHPLQLEDRPNPRARPLRAKHGQTAPRRGNGDAREQDTARHSEGDPPPPLPPPAGPEPEPSSDPPPRLPDGTLTEDVVLDVFNRRYMLVKEGGKVLIFERHYDPMVKRLVIDRLTLSDFRALYANRAVVIGHDHEGKEIKRKAGDWWLGHADRKQYVGGVVFHPSRTVDADTLNLWEGFAVKPRPGDWPLLQRHILHVICGGDHGLCDWVLNWIARLVQHPDERAEVCIVIRSTKEGTGKSTLGRVLMRILGQHSFAVTNPRHLTGNFNGHLRDCVFLLGDEAFQAGDETHASVLKTLITEPTLTIEGKHRDAILVPNYLHPMLTANNDWVVPAGLTARRFLVLDASEAYANDRAYFAPLWAEIDGDGLAAFLHDMLARDISGFNHRQAPDTAGLQEQKTRSLKVELAWWLDVLHRGYVWDSKLGLESFFRQWHDPVATDLLYKSYAEFSERRRAVPMGRGLFGRFLVAVGGEQCQPRNISVGEHRAEVDLGGGRSKIDSQVLHSKRERGYAFGLLSDARARFEDHTGLRIEWEQADEWENDA